YSVDPFSSTHLHRAVGVHLVHEWRASPRLHEAQLLASDYLAVVIQRRLALLGALVDVIAPLAAHHDAVFDHVDDGGVLTEASNVNAKHCALLAVGDDDSVHRRVELAVGKEVRASLKGELAQDAGLVARRV